MECSWIRTPAFERIAQEGIYFSNAYTPNAKCAPSRACLLTGRNSWQLKEAANMWCNFPAEFKTYMEVLGEHGYYVGHTAKVWGPGDPGQVNGERRLLGGKAWNNVKLTPPTTGISKIDYAANFEEFYEQKPDGQPFCFWYGATEPHRQYEYASSLKSGRELKEIDEVPAFFPDNDVVRTDMLDYGLEIEYFDSHIMRILEILEKNGELENTLVVVTSDHGMPFPRAKTDAYDYSNHVFLAMMWKGGIKRPGRMVDDYVSFIDLAPTFLDVAGVAWEESGMQPTPGKSLNTVFRNTVRDQAFRDHVLIGKEKHGVGRPGDYGYPIRGIVRNGWLYIRNYRNDLWPVGNPQAGYADIGGSPTKTEVLKSRHNPETKYLWELSFGKRQEEELYRLEEDPYCIKNLAADGAYSRIADELKSIMEAELKKQDDPRMFGNGDVFQNYKSVNKQVMNYYERLVVNKEDFHPNWVNASDIETDFPD
jgi:arylsulfatase A-like enzyme